MGLRTEKVVPIKGATVLPASLLEDVLKARGLKGDLSQAEARARDLRKEKDEIEGRIKAHLATKRSRLGTFRGKVLVTLVGRERAGYVVKDSAWDEVVYS